MCWYSWSCYISYEITVYIWWKYKWYLYQIFWIFSFTNYCVAGRDFPSDPLAKRTFEAKALRVDLVTYRIWDCLIVCRHLYNLSYRVFYSRKRKIFSQVLPSGHEPCLVVSPPLVVVVHNGGSLRDREQRTRSDKRRYPRTPFRRDVKDVLICCYLGGHWCC